MASQSNWTGRAHVRLDSHDPFLNLHFVIVFVRDQERSLRFYVDQLGFKVAVDFTFPSGDRWVEVGPPDGSAQLALVKPRPGSEEEKLIGRFTFIYFLTEDVGRKFAEWSKRGVSFSQLPHQPEWGGVFARFEDVDGNSFGLSGFDEATREIEGQRQAYARKMETERRAAQELEIARQVQARLFPQTLPDLRSLDYAGTCRQARQVGGDYYDFLNLGTGRLGLIVGDISGKGMAAALLMANLQANLRSQSAIAVDNPERLLQSVNRLFFENTADNAYATLFFAQYHEPTRQLTYANCGHLPALVLKRDGGLERLESTATVLGLFDKWDCELRSCDVAPGDVLTIYTDGVTEAENDQGQEFGEERLAAVLRRSRNLPARDVLASVVDEVQQFNAGEQHDDITAIVVKGNL